MADPELGAYSGRTLDVPPGQHWLDFWIAAWVNTLGWHKAAAYLGIDDPGPQPDRYPWTP